MFRFTQQQNVSNQDPSSDEESHSGSLNTLSTVAELGFPDRRKLGGERVSCACVFTLPNTDPDSEGKGLVSGSMVFNTRGCSLYLEPGLTSDETKNIFPEYRLVVLTDLVFSTVGSSKIGLHKLNVRRIRLISDERGPGIVLRFVNLTEQQLGILTSIIYAHPNEA